MENRLIVSSSPHMKSMETVPGVMLNVIIALVPATIIGIYFFSYIAGIVLAVSIASCVLFEFLYNLLARKKQTIGDCSAIVTGLLLGLNLPPAASSIWLSVIGAFVAVVVLKMIFGGIGQNVFNPALGARVFLTVAFASQMTNWIGPGTDGVSSATPLAMAQNGVMVGYLDLFLGNIPGAIGETSAFALLIGGAWLLIRKIISWEIPVFYILTAGTMALVAGQDPLFHILSAGLMIGAIYMATDYSTSPITRKGKIIFGVGCGLITMSIRLYGSLPEGTSFAILFMNILVPLIDRYTLPRTFGERKRNA
ncbi:MAG: RnfABCDGE type electron transport complex subunit D [Clostridia bacterium]